MLINFKCNIVEKILDTHKFWNQIRLNWENIIDQCYRKRVRNRTLCLYWNVSSTRSTLITVFKILVPLIGLSFSNPRHCPTFNFVPLYLSTSKILHCLPYLLHMSTVSLARVLSQKLEIACQYCSLIHPKTLGHFLVYSKYSKDLLRDFLVSPAVKTLPFIAGQQVPSCWGAKTPHASGPKHQNIRQKQYYNKFNRDLKNCLN